LSPNIKGQELLFYEEFIGMLHEDLSCEELINIVLMLTGMLKEQFTENENNFYFRLQQVNQNGIG
jgi:hypothetical protein